MTQVNNDFEHYIDIHTTPEDDILANLTRFTNLTTRNPRMLCGRQQGLLLQMICQMLKPRNVLEIGTFTGYSAIHIARGIMPDGHLDTIEVNDEMQEVIHKYWGLANVNEFITLHIGDALEIIPKLSTKYDLVFIDGDKREYPEYYRLVFPLVKMGGFIIADNVLWNGKVIDPDSNDIQTTLTLEFNKIVQNDSRVENTLLPMRDGLMLMRKIAD